MWYRVTLSVLSDYTDTGCVRVPSSLAPIFTEEELTKFACRYEEGYDLECDSRYNLWLETYHPSETSLDPPCLYNPTQPFPDGTWENAV